MLRYLPFENKTALEKKNKRTHYVRYGERAEVCWERIVQQEWRGEIVRGRKCQTASGQHTEGRYEAHLCLRALLRARQ